MENDIFKEPCLIVCSNKFAQQLLEKDEEFKNVLLIAPWLDGVNDEVSLIINERVWRAVVDMSEMYGMKEINNITKVENHESD